MDISTIPYLDEQELLFLDYWLYYERLKRTNIE